MTDTSEITRSRESRARSWVWLARHYAEMLIAMSVSMMAFGALRIATGLTIELADHPGWSFLLMATEMSLGMAAWMRYRGHGWATTSEMCAAMYLPVLLLPFVQADAMSAMTFMIVAHVVMSVAMLVVLIRRRRELTHC